MSQHIKTGHLQYFYRGLLSKKWKKYYFVLFDDSTLQWYEKQNDRKPDGSIHIRDIAQNLCVGPYTRCLSNRPELPRPTDEANLIALPRSSPGHHDQEIIWILCNDVTHLNDWMKAIVSTLPPSPQHPSVPSLPQQNAAIRPSAHLSSNAPPPYPRSTSYLQQQQPIYPKMHDNQQSTYHYTNVVVQPSPSYGSGGGYSGINRGGGGSSLVSAGVGFAGGALLGGALGYAWGGGFGGHGGWGYGMGPIGHHGGYGGWGLGDNDTTVINNYYDNDTMNNYNNSVTNNNFSTYNETNTYNDNDNQQNNFQYETNNNQQSGNNGDGNDRDGGGNEDFGGGDDHFDDHGGDNHGGDGYNYGSGGGDDYGGGDHDNGVDGADNNDGSDDYGGGGDNDGGNGNDYGGDDFNGGGGDVGGVDFGNGDW